MTLTKSIRKDELEEKLPHSVNRFRKGLPIFRSRSLDVFACAISECWCFFFLSPFFSIERLIENVRNFKRIESAKNFITFFTPQIEVRSIIKKNRKANRQCIEKCQFGTNRFAYQFYIKAKLIYRNETRPYNICACVCSSVGMIFFFFIRIKWFASSLSKDDNRSMDGWLELMEGEKWNMREIHGN